MRAKSILSCCVAALVISVFLHAAVVWADIPTMERNALIALYNNTDGDNWLNKSNWKVGGNFNAVGTECTWQGVMCNAAEDAVISVALNNNHLSGSIPAELGNLSALSELHLYGNQLTGSIPPELAGATLLYTLDLSSNQLTGSIPSTLGSLDSLSALLLNNNQLSGTIPSELGNLQELRYLYLNSNNLSGSIPPELGNSSGYMNDMRLSNNHLTGTIPASLGTFTNLQALDLDHNRLTGEIPPELGGNKPLMWRFNLSHNQLSGSIPSALNGSGCNPSYIYLNDNQLSGSLPASLGSMVGGELFLQSNQLSGAIPPEFINIWVYDGTGLDLRWNALHSDDAAIIAQLNVDQIGGDWQSSQTIAPENASLSSIGDHTAWLAWDAVSTTIAPGGYALYVKETTSSDWLLNGIATSKSTVSFPVTGLNPGTQYDFAIATYTDPHSNNLNRVISDLSPLVSDTTTSSGCDVPVINIDETPPWTLGVTATFDSYLWSTGESTQSIFVTPTGETSYWVTTSSGGCEESAVATVSSLVFDDDFESGSTARWSAQTF